MSLPAAYYETHTRRCTVVRNNIETNANLFLCQKRVK